MYMQSLFEGRKRDLEKLTQFIKLIMKKFFFNRRTPDTDSVSIPKEKNVITTWSGRQVKPPKKLCLWLFIGLLFINSLLFSCLLFINNIIYHISIYPFIINFLYISGSFHFVILLYIYIVLQMCARVHVWVYAAVSSS